MKFSGCWPALVTPMRAGQVDVAALHAFVDWQIAAGVAGVVAVGTTGESATLTVDEHKLVVREVVKAARGRVPVVAGAGANATAEAVELSVACAEAGAQALLHVTPAYNRPTQAGLVAHFRAVAAATPLPILLYNVPSRTACDLLPETVAQLMDEPTIVGLKEAHGGIQRATDLALVRRAGGRRPAPFALLSGDDGAALPYMSLGFDGVISVTANVAPAHVVAMCAAAQQGDWVAARNAHLELAPLTRLLFVESNPIPAKKALAQMVRMTCDVRLPLLACSEALGTQLHAELERLGLL